MSKLTAHVVEIGKKYGRLLVKDCISLEGRPWSICLCDCGNEITARSYDIRRGVTASCGCLKLEKLVERSTKHQNCNTKTYYSWSAIKSRCYNTNNEFYHLYGGRGISMSPLWKDDFAAFYTYIGDPPDDGKKYSVDRIDYNKNYEPGNVRWATDKDQARNRGMKNGNKTGVTGVSLSADSDGNARYVARWIRQDGGGVYKSFSVNKYGKEEAFRLACEARENAIKELNAQGAGYSEYHGKPRMEG